MTSPQSRAPIDVVMSRTFLSLFWICLLLLLPLLVNAGEEYSKKGDEQNAVGVCETSAVDEIERPANINLYNTSIHHKHPKKKFTENFSMSVSSDFYSRYVVRGQASSEGPVWQPSVTLEYSGVGVSVWSNFVLGDEPNQGEFNEVDFTFYYRGKIKKLSFNTWLFLEFYPNADPASLDYGTTTLEYHFHLSYPVGPVDLFSDFLLRFFPDTGSVFWDVGVGYQKELPLGFSLSVSTLFALANAQYVRAEVADLGTKPFLAEVKLSFPWAPFKGNAEGLTFTPSVTVSNLLAPSLRRAVKDPTIVWGGLSIEYSL